MVTEGFGGGRLLNNAVAAEGTLLYLRFFEKAISMSRAQWGEMLCGAVKGLFGPDFENRLEACIRRDTKEHENGFSQDEEIPFEPLCMDWPKIGDREIEEEKAAHIRFCAVEESLREESGDIPQWEEAEPETAEKIAQIAAQIRPQDTIKQMREIINIKDDDVFFKSPSKALKSALLEIPPYLFGQMRMEKKEKDAILESVAKIFCVAFDMYDRVDNKDSVGQWYDGWGQWADGLFALKETDPIFQSALRWFRNELLTDKETPDSQGFRKSYMKKVALNCGDGDEKGTLWGLFYKNFVEYRMIVEGLACLLEDLGNADRVCCTVKAMLGLEYAEQVDQILKDERKAYRRRRKRRSSSSAVPEFDRLEHLSWNKCAEILKEIPENTLIYALKGASKKAEDMLWHSLPEKRWQAVEEYLDIPINVRLKDVEEAQRAILEKAEQMFGKNCLGRWEEDADV